MQYQILAAEDAAIRVQIWPARADTLHVHAIAGRPLTVDLAMQLKVRLAMQLTVGLAVQLAQCRRQCVHLLLRRESIGHDEGGHSFPPPSARVYQVQPAACTCDKLTKSVIWLQVWVMIMR